MTFALAPKARFGIAIRLAVSFLPKAVAMAVLAVPVTAASAPESGPLPGGDSMLHAMDRLERVVDASADADMTEVTARYQRAAAELDRAADRFVADAAAAGEAPPGRFATTVRSYRQRGSDLINLTATRRARMGEYSAHFEQLNTRLKKSLEHASNLPGRGVARQSLVRLAGNLDDLRRRYVEFVSADTVDSSFFDTLGTSEGALGQTLAQEEAGFSRAEGQDWYEKSKDDLQAMSTARRALLQIDRQRKNGARRFGADSEILTQIVSRVEKAETYVARPSTTIAAYPQESEERNLLAWLCAGVMLLVICISAGRVRSIVRPVRRLLDATGRTVKAENVEAIAHDGIRELDTLAVAFNDMAAELDAARRAARGQQHLLEAKVAERTLELQELAQLDPLTGLANRRHFFTLLNRALEAAAREKRLVGVFFLDVDNFKNMNDSLGREFGDQILQRIARRLSEATHSFGFAARLGGDEFTVVYESASSAQDIRIAGLQLVKAFEEPVPLEGRDLIVSISAGAGIYPQHGQNAEALLRAADTALYEAKALGRSQLALFNPALLEAAAARSTTERGLRRATEHGEFELVFQPEVNLQTCETELVEALLRWKMPDGRLLPPADFLQVAEASGLILKINDWVLRHVIETAARWHQGSWPEVRVALNVSSRQLFDSSFVEQVLARLEEFKLPPRCLEIELTESVLQTGSATIAALRRLRAHGIAIALDDFGTGFSSLASLEQLPLTRIKLDRSLVASIDTSARSASIARAIIQLCQGLGLAVTAEGIERPEQLVPLVGYPALCAQGYLLARPQSPDELLPVIAGLRTHTQALVRASVARLPEAQLAENLPFVGGGSIKH